MNWSYLMQKFPCDQAVEGQTSELREHQDAYQRKNLFLGSLFQGLKAKIHITLVLDNISLQI